MDKSIIERVRKYINSKGISVRAYANIVGFNYSTLNNYFTGRRRTIDSSLIEKTINSFDDISPEWLITGKGEMFKQARESISIANNEGISNSQIGNNIGNNQISLALPSAGQQKIIDSAGKITTIEINNADDIRIAQLRREYEVLIQRIAELERTISAQEKLINMYEKNS